MRENATEPTRQEINEAIAKACGRKPWFSAGQMFIATSNIPLDYFDDPKACEEVCDQKELCIQVNRIRKGEWCACIGFRPEFRGKTLAEATARAIYEAIK